MSSHCCICKKRNFAPAFVVAFVSKAAVRTVALNDLSDGSTYMSCLNFSFAVNKRFCSLCLWYASKTAGLQVSPLCLLFSCT